MKKLIALVLFTIFTQGCTIARTERVSVTSLGKATLIECVEDWNEVRCVKIEGSTLSEFGSSVVRAAIQAVVSLFVPVGPAVSAASACVQACNTEPSMN